MFATVGGGMKSLSLHAIAAMFALIITLLVGLALALPFGRGLEAWMGDRMQTWRYDLMKKFEPNRKPDARLILAAIDQQSVNDQGRWPFPRTVDAEFLGVLSPAKPKVVTWDIFFTEKTRASPTQGESANGDNALQQDDAELVEGAKLIPHLVLAAAFDPDGTNGHKENYLPTKPLPHVQGDKSKIFSDLRAIFPFSELRRNSQFGFADAPATDQRRLMPLVVYFNGDVFASLSLQTLIQYWGDSPDQVFVDLGHEITLPRDDGTTAHIPIDEEGRLLTNYRACTKDFLWRSFSVLGKGLHDVANNLSSDERKDLPAIKDQIVVVGVTLSGTDQGQIPIEPYSPLVIAHLNVLNNVLQGDYLHAVNTWLWLPVYFLFLFGVGNAMLRVGISPMIPIGIGAVLVSGLVVFSLLYFVNFLMPLVLPEMGVLILAGAVPTQRFFGEEREKRRIKGMMRAYLSDKVMAKVLAHPDNLKLGGVKQEITIMFCDIRGFTAYCDNRDPQETMDVLNQYMEIMTQVVFNYEGTIDKYIGDCIMAFWNAPELQPDHAQRAVLCALEMRQALVRFKEQAGPGAENFECGIGIHTGEALIGNMGSSFKRNYTAMGSNVNLAARLESITKKLGERIVISQDTLNQLYGDLIIVDRGDVEVSGFALPVHLYAVRTEPLVATAPEEPLPPQEAVPTEELETLDGIYQTSSLPLPPDEAAP